MLPGERERVGERVGGEIVARMIPGMVLHDIVLHCMVLHSIVLHCMVLYSIVWYCMVLCGMV